MCETHTHGPDAIATVPQHISWNAYLNQRVATALEQTLTRTPTIWSFLTDETVAQFTTLPTSDQQLAYIIDKITLHYTMQAGNAYMQGDSTKGNALMQEMKEAITKAQQEIANNKK